VVQSTVMALLGGRLGWHRMVRTGAATAHITATTSEPPGARAVSRAVRALADQLDRNAAGQARCGAGAPTPRRSFT
jgi:hypothetical protein